MPQELTTTKPATGPLARMPKVSCVLLGQSALRVAILHDH